MERVLLKPPAFAFGPDGSADMVLTFRNIHNWMPEGYQDQVFAAACRALPPGGVFGVADHRGKPGMTPKQIEDTGYIPEDVVIALAAKAGFRLADRSEVNGEPQGPRRTTRRGSGRSRRRTRTRTSIARSTRRLGRATG